MSTATSSVTTSDPSWATPSSQVAAPQWQSQEQYQQYYNYYQAMSQAAVTTSTTAVTTTASDPAAAYPQDYSKAWDEYYKAYYGQAYTVSASATQYPATGYNYDQYGYPNLAAPPPAYQYDTTATSTAYQYAQPPPVAAVAPVVSAAPVTSTAYSYADTNYTAPPASSWNEPPPSFDKPATYNQSYQQASTYEKTSQSFDQKNSYSVSDTRATNINDTNVKQDNYMDRFPPPSFESGNKQGSRTNYRGRGYNKSDQRPMDNRDDNFRRPPRGNRFGQSNNKNSRGSFNDRCQYDNDDMSQYNNNDSQPNNYDRPQYNSNDYQNDDIGYGGRGGRGGYRGRGGESTFRGRGNDGGFRGRGGNSSFRGSSGYDNSNRQSFGQEDQGWNENDNSQDYAWKSELDKPDPKKESPWEEESDSLLPGWTMGGPGIKRKSAVMDMGDGCNRLPTKVAPMSLMDIAVRPSGQSPIIVRRQGLIDQWQCAVREISERQQSINQYWTTLKSGLIPEVQGLLCPSFVRGDQAIHCELHLDDIFLIQAKGLNEDMAIEEASKSMWQLLQTKLYVHTANRSWGNEKVPVFCVSRNVSGPVSCPSFIKGVAPSDNKPIPSALPINTPKAAINTPKAAINTPKAAINTNVPPGKGMPIPKPVAAGTPIQAKAPSQIKTPIIPAQAKAPTTATQVKAETKPQTQGPPLQHNYKEDDIFLVVDPSQNEKDQAISILNNTAKFNHITIEYKHEKPPNAPHISQCLITINGQEFEKSEARDYLFAKREAADKAVIIFKESCPQITLKFDQAEEVCRDAIMKPGKSYEDSITEFLKGFAGNSDEDVIYKFGTQFTNEDREAILKGTNNLNLSTKSEGKGILMVFKQFPVEEMKRRILRQGHCAQYRLVQCSLSEGSA